MNTRNLFNIIKLPVLPALLLLAVSLNAQQWVINDKDQTRPEIHRSSAQASFSNMSAEPFRGYNEISFSATNDPGASRYIVEYSIDGIDFYSAAETVASSASPRYSVKHYTNSTEPLLYRIRTETSTGKRLYSNNFTVDGIPIAPLRIIPNTITNQTMNVNSNWELLRLNIFSLDGQQVFAKDLNGVRDFIPVAIPGLGKGMYIATFFGDGWQYSQKIVVP